MCDLCNSKEIEITVKTKRPEDMYIFANNEVVGMMFCPLCGKDLRKEVEQTFSEKSEI